ncbi:GntR family transcriptional regulator [Sulfolobus sp. A20]|uniref:GntR family transcriptional regulator n=1 Tax=Sulfolobaceae TaxID=118883 RepID=UPI0008460B6E|nr:MULTISPECIES: GntR family transcriptional regulator [unclassified Sulfolobus]TRM78837.1 GntR family transcriptional regulator [Sulfolobus sp. B5]TRM79946.1 GntR family transcriptional regulator [Sulfolobus sp. D5]TRM84672.1 GntR family transcriptional regulator [Sulfolobus sp. F3]TRM87370.1 GntR family transcriptional regulator [Sulfolobus sp. C3]TRM95215.1 GntR family transcriptional regulator [Sulfolobus sp. A20-N-G8]TRN02991.1 GntR family transcriptional regulator [Sulfolobus sp. F1]TR
MKYITIKVDFSSNVPIYKQIANSIIELIAKGELKPGDKLPSIRELATMLGINMLTVDKAYKYLVDEGFLTVYKKRFIVRTDIKDEYWKNMLKVVIYRAIASKVSKEEILKEIEDIVSSLR